MSTTNPYFTYCDPKISPSVKYGVNANRYHTDVDTNAIFWTFHPEFYVRIFVLCVEILHTFI